MSKASCPKASHNQTEGLVGFGFFLKMCFSTYHQHCVSGLRSCPTATQTEKPLQNYCHTSMNHHLSGQVRYRFPPNTDTAASPEQLCSRRAGERSWPKSLEDPFWKKTSSLVLLLFLPLFLNSHWIIPTVSESSHFLWWQIQQHQGRATKGPWFLFLLPDV